MGSENSSGAGAAGGGVWKSGNLEIWNLGIWEPGNPEFWGPIPPTKKKISKSKSVLPKMSARSGLVGKQSSRPIWGHLRQFFHGPKTTTKKKTSFCQFSLVGQWALFTRCAPLLLSTRCGEIGRHRYELGESSADHWPRWMLGNA